MALSRAEPIMQSAQEWVRGMLDGLGYANHYIISEVSPAEPDQTPLATTVLVFSMADRDTPDDLEVGGPLCVVRTSIVIDVLGKTEALGMNIASLIHDLATDQRFMPLLEFADSDPTVVTKLEVANVLQNRLYFTNPSPWQEHWHVVTLVVNDEYNRSVS